MAVYAITGKLGSGKGKGGIDQIRRYLQEGRRVATNCDVFLEHLMPGSDKSSVLRIPDKPSHVDLYMIGSGNRFIEFDVGIKVQKGQFVASAPSPRILKGFDERHNGALVLDECGSWLNTRNFQDAGRAQLLEWAIHARKYGWDVFFIMQNISQVDKQLRESLLEYVVRMNRLDRMKIPFLSAGLKAATAGALDGSLPRLHVGVVRLGAAPDALVVDRWIFRGDDLNNAYSTTQVFSDAYPHGVHSLLSSWHLSAHESNKFTRRLPPKPVSPHMTKFLVASMLLGIVLGAFVMRVMPASVLPVASAVLEKPVYSTTIKGVGVLRVGSTLQVVLSDGRTISPIRFRTVGGGWEAQIEKNLWVRGS
jgi:hypothetical protein